MSDVKCESTVPLNNEDKLAWCHEGELREDAFIQLMNRCTYLQVELNPRKATDKKAPDLVVPGYGECDLKAVQTPFFLSGRWGFDPYYAITLNLKDVIRYRSFYPDMGIFFWVQWPEGISKEGKFAPQPYKWAVYFTTMGEVLRMIDQGIAHCHSYQKRAEENTDQWKRERGMTNDGNAAASYILDTRWMTPIAVTSKDPRAA
jgi:hypothetical protein